MPIMNYPHYQNISMATEDLYIPACEAKSSLSCAEFGKYIFVAKADDIIKA